MNATVWTEQKELRLRELERQADLGIILSYEEDREKAKLGLERDRFMSDVFGEGVRLQTLQPA